ncbi:MAG TPA: AsmA-like C-terminal region-containing protein, partial [Longimicrobiales bacterium]
GMPEVPPIQMDGKIRAAQFVRGGVRFDDVDVTIAARNGEMDVRGASFKLMGGDVQITGRLGLASSAAQALVLDYKANDLKAQQFIQRFTNFRDQISGTMLLGGSVQMSLDKQLLPVRESMNGAGTVAVLNGEIINWPLLKALGQKLGASSFDTIAFKDWNGRYRIAGSRLIIEESEMDARELSVRAAGSVDLDGTLDLGATLLLPQEHAARIPGAPTAVLVKSASDSAGRVPVGAKIKGTARQPSIALDMSEAGKRSVQTARNAAEQEAKKAAASVADKIAQRVLPKDSTTATDSTKAKMENVIGGGIKKLFKPKT